MHHKAKNNYIAGLLIPPVERHRGVSPDLRALGGGLLGALGTA